MLDCSRWSREKDSALNNKLRLEMMMNLSMEFVNEYYDQNPLGHLGIVLVREGEAEMLTTLGGSPKRHTLALSAGLVSEMKRSGKDNVGGEFSLQNGIEVAGRSLGYAPRYGSREILVITSALATSDPGDILGETLPRLLHAGIRVSTVSMQAEMHICKRLADETSGLAGVCLDANHLRDLIMGHAIPPPVSASHLEDDDNETNNQNGDTTQQNDHGLICEFVTMGFPSKDGTDVPTLVHTTGGGVSGSSNNAAFSINPATVDDRRNNRLIAFARTAYVCPRCRSRCSDLPSDCAVCGLRLILAPHLARTFHHLFPVRPFEELEEAAVISNLDADGDASMSDVGGDKSNGKNGLEALPAVSSSAFTPISSISSAAVTSFVVSSTSSSSHNNTQQNDAHMNQNTPNSKIIEIGPSLMVKSTDCDRCCFGCLKIIGCRPIHSNNNEEHRNGAEESEAILRFQCPECRNVFCPDCDAYLHETLHNCPGCLCN